VSNIHIEDLHEGMIVKGEVRDPRGRVILEANSVLTIRHIKTFKSWGITAVEICDVGSNADSPKEKKNDLPEALKEEMSQLFRYANPKSEVVRELFRVCVKRKLNREKEGGTSGS